MRIYVNGKICSGEEAVVSVYDHGFLYGIGLFETFRTYKGRPFLLEEHLLRLSEGCRELGIRYAPDSGSIRQAVSSLLEANRLPDGYFRLSVSAGTDVLGLPSGDYAKPNVMMYVKELPAVPAAGRALQLLTLTRNTPEGRVRFKSFHYMNNLLAKRELARYPWAAGAEGLLLDDRGFIAEGIVSNVFFVSQGICFAPSIDTGILPGITRAWVIRFLERQGIAVREGRYGWEDLLKADEIFLTNSIQEIVPVTALLDHKGNRTETAGGTPGAVTKELMARYRAIAEEA